MPGACRAFVAARTRGNESAACIRRDPPQPTPPVCPPHRGGRRGLLVSGASDARGAVGSAEGDFRRSALGGAGAASSGPGRPASMRGSPIEAAEAGSRAEGEAPALTREAPKTLSARPSRRPPCAKREKPQCEAEPKAPSARRAKSLSARPSRRPHARSAKSLSARPSRGPAPDRARSAKRRRAERLSDARARDRAPGAWRRPARAAGSPSRTCRPCPGWTSGSLCRR